MTAVIIKPTSVDGWGWAGEGKHPLLVGGSLALSHPHTRHMPGRPRLVTYRSPITAIDGQRNILYQ